MILFIYEPLELNLRPNSLLILSDWSNFEIIEYNTKNVDLSKLISIFKWKVCILLINNL